jgi:hypothetical protein
MKQIFVVALGLFLICDAFSSATRAAQDDEFDRSYKPPAPLRYKTDAKTLYEAGFSVRSYNTNGALLAGGTSSVGPSYPNKCFLAPEELTLSDQFYAHYKARGFSLASLCLAATSGDWVKYDIQTGKPLRVVNGFLVDIPDCFKNGTPFLDCTYNFEHTFGLKVKNAERASIRKRAIDVDKAIRQLMADGKFSRECTCDDLEITREQDPIPARKERFSSVKIKGSGSGKQQPVQQFACRVDRMPPCVRDWLAPRRLGGWMLYEVDDGVHFKWTPLSGFTDYGPFEISPELPRGYAYRIGSPEGDDDSPFLDVTPGTKLNVRE